MPPRPCTMILSLALAVSAALAGERPHALMMQVPTGLIRVDGSEADWQRLGTALPRYRITPDLSTNLLYANPDQGDYAGIDDLFFQAWVAVDADNLYVLAHVRDQLLFHDAPRDRIYEGDDLELFVDANPPDALFASNRNDNCRQLIFVPQHVSTTLSGPDCIWSDQPAPGVEMASRLTPWGYVMEVKVPKSIFPNWQAHPEQGRIGFDMSVSDSDSAGVDSHHGPMKYVGFLLSPGQHFRSNEALAMLSATPETIKPSASAAAAESAAPAQVAKAVQAATDATAETVAGDVLALIDSPAAAPLAAAAAKSPFRSLRKAGLLIFAKCPGFDLEPGIVDRLHESLPDGYLFDPDLVSYALVALARRGKLPVSDFTYDRFGLSFVNPVRLTYTWCLGANGDPAAVPWLVKQLADKNLRVRIKAAISLGELHDAAALPALEDMAKKDHPYAQGVAKAAIATIGEKPANP